MSVRAVCISSFVIFLIATWFFYLNSSNSYNLVPSEILLDNFSTDSSNGNIEISSCSGDLNGDGDIDGADLAVFINSHINNCLDVLNCSGDFDGNGNIDEFDFEIFSISYGKNDCPIQIPEEIDFGLQFDEQKGGSGLIAGAARLINGNAVEKRTDIEFPSPHGMGLKFKSFYNNRSENIGGLGFGWSHSYAIFLELDFIYFGQIYARIIDETGRSIFFSEYISGSYKGAFNEKTRLERHSNGFVWNRLDGSHYGFSLNGRLEWIDDEKGNRLKMLYDSEGLLESIVDISSNRMLQFKYGPKYHRRHFLSLDQLPMK